MHLYVVCKKMHFECKVGTWLGRVSSWLPLRPVDKLPPQLVLTLLFGRVLLTAALLPYQCGNILIKLRATHCFDTCPPQQGDIEALHRGHPTGVDKITDGPRHHFRFPLALTLTLPYPRLRQPSFPVRVFSNSRIPTSSRQQSSAITGISLEFETSLSGSAEMQTGQRRAVNVCLRQQRERRKSDRRRPSRQW